MDSTLVLDFPTGYTPGQEVHHPDDPPGEWDWLINLVSAGIREQLWSSFVGYVQGQFSQILGPLREVRDRIAWAVAAIWAIPGAIRGEMAALKDRLVATLAYWLWRLLSAANSLRDRVVGGFYSLRDSLLGSLAFWLNRLQATLDGLRDRAVGSLYSLRDSLLGSLAYWLGRLQAHLDALRDRAVGSLYSLRDSLLGSLAYWLGRLQAALDALSNRLEILWTQTLAILHALPHLFWNQVKADVAQGIIGFLDIGSTVLAGMAVAVARGPSPELQAAMDRFTAISEASNRVIADTLLKQGHITPTMAPAVGGAAFALAVGMGFSAHLLATAIELAHPLRYVGLHYLSGFLGEMASYSRVANATLGQLIQTAVAIPHRYYVQMLTRPMIPTSGELQAMRRKHNLTPAEFAEYMAYQGYSKFWVDRFEEYLPADPRLYEILRMADTHLPTGTPPAAAIPLLERLGIRSSGNPNWWLEMKFALAGYNWIDIPQLIEVVKQRLTNSARLRLISTAGLNFRQGYMEESQYRLELAEAGQNPEQIEWRARAEKLSALKDDILDLEKLYTDRYLKDVITEDDLLVALVNAGVTSRKARILVARAAIRKQPKPTSPSRKEEEAELRKFQTKASDLYKRQYQADLITADQYFDSLRAIGITERLAAMTVQVEMTKKSVQARKVAIREEEKAVTKTRRVYEKLYREQFRAGDIGPDQYLQLLLDQDLTPAQAQGTVALEILKLYKLQERAELKAEEKLALQEQRQKAKLYVRRYRAGDIDAATLLDRLIGLEIPRVLAETTVTLEELRLQEEAEKVLAQVIVPALRIPFDLAVARLKELLAAGEISLEEYLHELLESGLAEETVRLIAQVTG